jgi:hypothetical protein
VSRNDDGIFDRFIDKVNFHPSDVAAASAGCWEWTGSTNERGYGQLMTRSRIPAKAHRLSYEFFVGEIPEGLCVMHACDNRKCVNPGHLSVGTQADNLRDMREKGRGMDYANRKPHNVKGEHNGRSKLRNGDIRHIRGAYLDGTKVVVLADAYQVTVSCIYNIISRRNWGWVK